MYMQEEYEGRADLYNHLKAVSVEAVQALAAAAEQDGQKWYGLAREYELYPQASYRCVDFAAENDVVVTVNRHEKHGLNENAGFVRLNLQNWGRTPDL